MAVFGPLAIVRAQVASAPSWVAAWTYLEEALQPNSEIGRRIAALAPGETHRVELAGGIFALEQAYWTKPRPDGRWEAHQAHLDLQAMVAGTEAMEVVAAQGLTVTEDLLATRDVCFFAEVALASRLVLRAGEVAVFAPEDAHMPSLAVDAPALVRKTVVKVPVAR